MKMQFLGTPFVVAYIATVCNALDLLLWNLGIPTEAFDTVVQHFVNEDCDALVEFPGWGKFIHVTLVTNF
jgi:hypothetical protein